LIIHGARGRVNFREDLYFQALRWIMALKTKEPGPGIPGSLYPGFASYESSPRLGRYGPWKPGCPGPALKQLAGRSAKGPVQFGSAKAGATTTSDVNTATITAATLLFMLFTSFPFIQNPKNPQQKQNRLASPLGR